MNRELNTASTRFPNARYAFLPHTWDVDFESYTGLLSPDVNGSEIVVSAEQSDETQSTVEYALGTLTADPPLWKLLREPTHCPEESWKMASLGQTFASVAEVLPSVTRLSMEPSDSWGTLSGLLAQPRKVTVTYILQSPNGTAFLASWKPSNLQSSSKNRSELDALRENVEGDWVTPTQFAYEQALKVLNTCVDLPVAFMTTDGEGGVRLAWRRGKMQVRANFGGRPELKTYMYYESPDEHGVEDLQASSLAKRLSWLNA
jgi:hypothetical protein